MTTYPPMQNSWQMRIFSREFSKSSRASTARRYGLPSVTTEGDEVKTAGLLETDQAFRQAFIVGLEPMSKKRGMGHPDHRLGKT